MNLDKELSDDELKLMAKLLYRYTRNDMDQFDNLKFATDYGTVFVTLSRSSGGYDDAFRDITPWMKDD